MSKLVGYWHSLLQILSVDSLVFLVLHSGYPNPEVVTQCRNNKTSSFWLAERNLGLLVQLLLYMNSRPSIFIIVKVSCFRKSFLCKRLQ